MSECTEIRTKIGLTVANSINPFASEAFLESWWNIMGADVSPANGLTSHHGLIRTFSVRRTLGVTRVAEAAGRGVADYTDVDWNYVSRDDLREFLQCAVLKSHVDVLVLPRVIRGGGLEEAVCSSTLEMGMPVFRLRYDLAPFVSLDGDWDGFYERKKRKFRYNLRRAERRLAELGELRFLHLRTPDSVRRHMESAFQLYSRRAEHQYRARLWLSSRGQAMLTDLALRWAESGQLDLAFIKVGERPVAFSFGFYNEETYFLWATAFDPSPEHSRYSPGTLLIKHLLKEAFASGLRRFDFMLGDEPYKWTWATEHEEIFTYVIGGSGVRSRALFAFYCQGLKWRQRLRASRTAGALVRRVLHSHL